MKRVLVSWSGGKDAAWALHVLREDPDVEIVGLFTTLDETSERVPIHEVPAALLEAQADAIGVPLHRIPIPNPCPNALYEAALSGFLEGEKARGVTHLAFGDLFLEDIRAYRERQYANCGLDLLFPLWGMPTRDLAVTMTAAGLRAVITSVDTRQAPAHWAGEIYDPAFARGIPAGIDPCGERGEFHTYAFAGPRSVFSSAIDVHVIGRRMEAGFAYAELAPAGD